MNACECGFWCSSCVHSQLNIQCFIFLYCNCYYILKPVLHGVNACAFVQVTMRTGSEPPAIWKVQKALLQKFVPELRDGKRVFSATNSVSKS